MVCTSYALALFSLVIGPDPIAAALTEFEPPGIEDSVAPEAEAEAEAPEQEQALPIPEGGDVAAPPPPPTTATKREWMLVIAPGFDYLIGAQNAWRAVGGGFRFGGHAMLWAGAKGRFLIGGGPILHYSYIKDGVANDVIHLLTVNGDFLLGGGNQRFGIYWHLTTGLGYLGAVDGQTGTSIKTLGARAATGLGGFGKINDRFSIGALVDFGWAGGLWVNALLTANVHFGRRGDPL